MGRSTTKDRVRWSRPRRWSVWAGTVTLAVGALMILAPSAAAASARTITAPYSGTPGGYMDTYFSGCGGSTSETAAPFLNMTTGHATFAFSDRQVSCGKFVNNTDTQTAVWADVSPISLATGLQSIESNWKATFAVKLVATPGSKSQFAYAYFSVAAFGYITDNTNGSYHYESGSTLLSDSITSGTFSKTYKNFYSHDWWNDTFVSSHTYTLEAYYYAYLDVQAGPGSSSATASFSMASSTDQVVLESIVVS